MALISMCIYGLLDEQYREPQRRPLLMVGESRFFPRQSQVFPASRLVDSPDSDDAETHLYSATGAGYRRRSYVPKPV